MRRRRFSHTRSGYVEAMKDTGIQGAAQSAHAGAKQAADSNWVDGLARFGLSAKGFSYGLIGVLAGALVFGLGGQAASREGALEVLANESYGKVLLVALALGFTAYGLWRLVQAIFDRDDEGSGAKGIAKRLGYVGRAILYGVLTWTTLRLLGGSGGSGTRRRRGTERDVDGVRLAGGALARRARWADPDRGRGLQRVSRVHAEVRGELEDGGDEPLGTCLGRSAELARAARALRGLLTHRRLLRQGRVPVRAERGDRPGRGTAEGR